MAGISMSKLTGKRTLVSRRKIQTSSGANLGVIVDSEHVQRLLKECVCILRNVKPALLSYEEKS